MKILIKVLLVLIILGLGLYLFLMVQWGPYGKGGVVYIPQGYGVSQIALDLEKAGVVRNTWSFKLMARWMGASKSLQAGEYQFPAGVTPREVIDKLRRGERIIQKLTIPEGFTFTQIAQLIEQAGIAPASEVLARFKNPKLLSTLGFPAVSLEGYLFPETYEYDRSTTLDQLLNQMIQTFQKNFDPVLRQRAKQAGWTLPQVVTLASIIEKETGHPPERPLISSVFHNRLKIGMPLQSDPTIIYGLPNFDGNLRKKDIRNPHLYNTYVHVGLPPGPIASPGKESLRAVLFPNSTTFLFFVSKGDGSHYFTSTLEKHNAAVQKYQLGKGASLSEAPDPALPLASPGGAAEPERVYSRPLTKIQPMPGAKWPTPTPAAEKPTYKRPLMKIKPMPGAKSSE